VKQISNEDGLKSKQTTSMFNIKIEEQPEEILKWLYLGTNLPVWPEFYPYILHDLKAFQTKSLLLKEEGNIAGHVLIFHEDAEILYFGFFGVFNDELKKIEFLLNKLIDYGKQHNFHKIIGPVNIPIPIYGWGFLEKGSVANLYVGKPTNLPIYQEMFFQKGFKVKTKEITLEGPILKPGRKIMRACDIKNYEFFHPKNWEEVLKFKKDFFKLNENLPPESVITPGTEYLYENYIKFIRQYGDLFLINLLRYIPDNQIVGCLFCIPNPFRKNEEGDFDSGVAFIILINKKQQKQGLGGLLMLYTANEAWKNNLRYNATPFEISSIRSIKLTKKFGFKHKRTHLILEYLI